MPKTGNSLLGTFAAVLLLSQGALATPMTVQWADATGDPGPVGDVIFSSLTFNESGAWTAFWRADPAYPFTGNARFNLNLSNLSAANVANAVAPQVSLDGFHDFGAQTATTYSYSGITPYLANWHVGDQIITSNGLIRNSATFNSGAVGLDSPWGRDNLIASGTITSAIPEPNSLAIFLAGLGLISIIGRRKYLPAK